MDVIYLVRMGSKFWEGVMIHYGNCKIDRIYGESFLDLYNKYGIFELNKDS